VRPCAVLPIRRPPYGSRHYTRTYAPHLSRDASPPCPCCFTSLAAAFRCLATVPLLATVSADGPFVRKDAAICCRSPASLPDAGRPETARFL